MANYTRFMQRGRDPGRVTWVCGTEWVLREEVVDHVRDQVGAADYDSMAFVGGGDADRDIWAGANQYPVDPSAPRFVLVREAERIRHWLPLKDWITNSRALPTVHLVFVSSEPDFTKEDDKLAPPCSWIRQWSSGDLVRCSPLAATVPTKNGRPTRAGPSDAVAWVQNICPMSERTAIYLLTKSGGDLSRAKNTAIKARMFGGLTERAVDLLGTNAPEEDFVLRLIALDKAEAIKAAPLVPPSEYPRVLGEVEYRLQTVSKVQDLLRQRRSAHEAGAVGLPVFAAKQVWTSAKHYDDRKQEHCRKVLAMLDEYVQSGSRDGVLEGLVALW